VSRVSIWSAGAASVMSAARTEVVCPMNPIMPANGQDREVLKRLRMDAPVDRLDCGDARADEDRRDDEVASALLGDEGSHHQRDRGQSVTEVVDQVRPAARRCRSR